MSSPPADSVIDDTNDHDYEAPPAPKKQRASAAGRKLMRWDPEKDQLVLLCVEYIATRDGVDLDWNTVAKVISPNLTGDAIKQHLFKLRGAREDAGQQVPPKLDRKACSASRKKGNTLIAPTKSTKRPTGTKRVRPDDDDDSDDEEPDVKPAVPKNQSLIHTKPAAARKSTKNAKRQKIKQEDPEVEDEDMGKAMSKMAESAKKAVKDSVKSVKGWAKKKRNRPSNFPEDVDLEKGEKIYEDEGPTLRAREPVNYSEYYPIDEPEEEEAPPEYEPPGVFNFTPGEFPESAGESYGTFYGDYGLGGELGGYEDFLPQDAVDYGNTVQAAPAPAEPSSALGEDEYPLFPAGDFSFMGAFQ